MAEYEIAYFPVVAYEKKSVSPNSRLTIDRASSLQSSGDNRELLFRFAKCLWCSGECQSRAEGLPTILGTEVVVCWRKRCMHQRELQRGLNPRPWTNHCPRSLAICPLHQAATAGRIIDPREASNPRFSEPHRLSFRAPPPLLLLLHPPQTIPRQPRHQPQESS